MANKYIESEIEKYSEELTKLEVGTDEYNDTLDALKELHRIAKEMDEAELAKTANAEQMALKKEELEYRVLDSKLKAKATKHSDWMNFFRMLGSGAVAILGVFCLGEVKESQGFVDKDKFTMLRNLFPKN